MNLAEKIAAIIENADNELIRAISRTQDTIYQDFLTLFKELELDNDGYIISNAANRALISKASGIFNRSIRDSGYNDAVNNFVGTFDLIDQANEDYFFSISDLFKPNRAFIAALQKQTITTLESAILNEGLTSQIKQPLLNILSQNINGGGSYSGFLEQLRANIVGIENEGKLMRYSRSILNDSLFNYSRAYQQSVTADLGLEFYYYSGGTTKDTREFCAQRLDQYWSQKEIESWASEDWQGKRPDTTESSIFIYCGGFNCRHSLIPVDKSIVPKDVIERQ